MWYYKSKEKHVLDWNKVEKDMEERGVDIKQLKRNGQGRMG